MWATLLATLAVANGASLRAVFTPTPPVLDGRLNDPAWLTAVASDLFTQKFPHEGWTPTERTVIRVVYDRDAVYVGIDCTQQTAPIVRRLTRRDRRVEADWVSIALGTRRDGKRAFEFIVNAAGVLSDGLRFDDTEYEEQWDENWDARTTATRTGWSAEIKIPLRILRFDSLPEQSWDFQARRYTSARQETDEWAFIPRSVGGEVSRYGKLSGLTHLQSLGQFELTPFVFGRVRRRDATTDQLARGVDFAASAGADIKWHPTQSLTIDAALNPDFAQVEADGLVLNLTNYETYYPEKRPFFLEGIDTFATPMQLLYTRRIGRAPQTPILRTGMQEQLIDAPGPAQIYGATKLTGRIGERWTIGALQAVTGENDIQVQLAQGSRVKRLADPLSSYTVLRVRRDLGTNADIGAMATAAVHSEPTRDFPQVAAALEQCPNGEQRRYPSRCFNDAYVVATDWRWRSPSGDYVTGGQAALSILEQGPPRLVPDGTVINPGQPGFGASAYLNKEGGKHWVGDVRAEINDRRFNINDLGYDRRANNYRFRVDVEYRELEPWWFMRESHVRAEVFFRRNLNGIDLGSGYQLNVFGKTTSNWEFFSEAQYRSHWFDDREIGDGTALERAALVGYELALQSDATKRVSFEMQTQAQLLFKGWYVVAEGGILFRALPQLDLELLPSVQVALGEPRFVGAGAAPGAYIFAHLDGKSVSGTLRATYTFAPRLSLQTYVQLFLSQEHYSQFSSDTLARSGPGAVLRLSDLRASAGPTAFNPDSERAAVNINVVLRWEFALGSTLFVVYTRSQAPMVALGMNDAASLSFAALNHTPAADALMIKLAYWFDPVEAVHWAARPRAARQMRMTNQY